MKKAIQELLARGVILPAPEAIEIGDDVPLENIAPGVILHAGCKVFGDTTSIGPGCVLGEETPATLDQCQLGQNVHLKGGYFSGAVFLDGAAMGSGAHVRSGTLLEEGAEMAHTVGLKQTIFFPYVVGGSLINFCDALMSGGTSRKVHSEIGSSFIHFNYTPRGDKATASLIGDVPHGVMLDQPPVFLGGQGGIAGPVRVAFGTVLAAGNVLRRDVLEPGQLVIPPAPRPASLPFSRAYLSITRLLRNAAIYIGNIAALQAWYLAVRAPLMATPEAPPHAARCHAGALRQLAAVRKERMKRLEAVMDALAAEDPSTLPDSLRTAHAKNLSDWPALRARLTSAGDLPESPDRAAFLAAWTAAAPAAYLPRLQALPPDVKQAGTRWLQQIVDSASAGL